MSRPFHGYRVAAVAALAFTATAPGQTFLVSQLNVHLRSELGLGETALASAYMVATVSAALPLVFVGRMTDRYGPRRALIALGVAFAAACMLFGAGARGLFTVTLGFFALRFLGQGSLSLVSSHALALWFHRRLGWINGAKTVAVFALWALLPPAVLAGIEAFGWRWTWAALGLGVFALVVPAAAVAMVDTPEEAGQRVDGDAANDEVHQEEAAFTLAQARGTPTYRVLAAASVLGPLIGTALLFCLQPMAQQAHLPLEVAAWAASSWSWTMALMALPSGWWVDRAPPQRTLPLAVVGLGLATAWFLVASTPAGFVGGMIAYATSQAILGAATATALARRFGRAHHGAIRASVTRMAVVGTGLGPVLLGGSSEALGGYGPALAGLAVVCLPLALAAWRLPPDHQAP